MFTKTCRCGKQTKNFKKDIGPFFIDECCTEAGYDHLGKKALDTKDLGIDSTKLDQDLTSDETKNLEIEDDSSLDQDLSDEEQEKLMDESDEEEADEADAKVLEEQLQADAQAEQAENTPIQPEVKLEVNEGGEVVQSTVVATITVDVPVTENSNQEEVEKEVAQEALAVLNQEPKTEEPKKRRRNKSGNINIKAETKQE